MVAVDEYFAAGRELLAYPGNAALETFLGQLVGVGTQSHTGKLDPGEANEMKVVLKDVNQDVARAATLFVSLETRR